MRTKKSLSLTFLAHTNYFSTTCAKIMRKDMINHLKRVMYFWQWMEKPSFKNPFNMRIVAQYCVFLPFSNKLKL